MYNDTTEMTSHRGMEAEDKAPVRPMSKKELALAYGPGLSMGGALKRLNAWLHYNADLMQALYAVHYRDNQRILTVRQVAIVYQYLGRP